jgi:hypothetical protein
MRDGRKRLRTGAFVGLLAMVFVLVAASVSGAALLKAGGLGSAATISLPEPVDTAFWLTARKGGGSAQIHTRGLVELVSVRGCARPAPTGQLPLTQIHIQTLTPGTGGAAEHLIADSLREARAEPALNVEVDVVALDDAEVRELEGRDRGRRSAMAADRHVERTGRELHAHRAAGARGERLNMDLGERQLARRRGPGAASHADQPHRAARTDLGRAAALARGQPECGVDGLRESWPLIQARRT